MVSILSIFSISRIYSLDAFGTVDIILASELVFAEGDRDSPIATRDSPPKPALRNFGACDTTEFGKRALADINY
jgi:hypothetical protein